MKLILGLCRFALGILALLIVLWACLTGHYLYACPHSAFTSFFDGLADAVTWGAIGVLGVLLIAKEIWPLALVGLGGLGYFCWQQGRWTAVRFWRLLATLFVPVPVLLFLLSYAFAWATSAHDSCSFGW
jgi:hypothetical protein